MELTHLWQTFVVVLGFYIVIFGFLRRLNELWSLVKLGRKVYKALPPGDMGWPLVGSSLSFYKAFRAGGDPDSFINHILSRNGRVGMYKSHLYGKPAIIVTNPEICQRIYSDDEHFKQNYPKSVKILLEGDTLYSKIDHKYAYRLVATPLKGSETLSHYVDYIEREVVEGLEEWSSMKEPIELLPELKTLNFKVISHVFMGHGLSDNDIVKLERLYTKLSSGVMSIFPFDIPGFIFHQALKARKEIENMLQLVIEEKRRALENKEGEEKCQMDALIEASDGNGEKLLKNKSIIDMLLGLLFAGHDTSAHAAMWALIHISQHPHVLKKAKEEQELIIKQRPSIQKGFSFKEIKQMKYLAKVINEVLRSSIATPNFREAKIDVNINGYTIPKGWTIPIWTRAVHMDSEIYPNPRAFDPARWDNYTPKAGSFLPFGLGNRYCPGSELAKLEITILLHHFLLNYKLERVNPKCQVTHIPIPKPVDNCLCKITRL